jgi:hypothetical protein
VNSTPFHPASNKCPGYLCHLKARFIMKMVLTR